MAALSTARALRDAGMAFVVAPRRTGSGGIVHTVDDRFAVALYPFVDGQAHAWGAYRTRVDRLAVLDLIVALHSAPAFLRRTALVDDLAIPGRDALDAALADRSGPWESSPDRSASQPDWDTAMVAPPERDLWALAEEDPQIIDDYTARTGTTPNPEPLELHRLWWDLTESGRKVSSVRR